LVGHFKLYLGRNIKGFII